MGHFLLSAWIGLGVGDVASTHVAFDHGGRELYLPNNPAIHDPLVLTTSTLGGVSTRYLWNHDHKRLAIALSVGNAIYRGWAISHNLHLEGRP